MQQLIMDLSLKNGQCDKGTCDWESDVVMIVISELIGSSGADNANESETSRQLTEDVMIELNADAH